MICAKNYETVSKFVIEYHGLFFPDTAYYN